MFHSLQKNSARLMTAVLALGASMVFTFATAGVASAATGLQLAQKNGCMACHQVERKVVGPSYKDVAAKYKSQKDAVSYLVAKVKKGGSGVWGPIPMPPQMAISEADLKVVIEWIMAQK